MNTTDLKQFGPWPSQATARIFLSHMAEGYEPSIDFLDPLELAIWLNQMELGAFAYKYFLNWDTPEAQIVTRKLEGSYWAGVAASIIKLSALEQVLRCFTSTEVDCTLLKGVAFGLTSYPEHAVRAMNDIDIWIQKKDLPLVWELFFEMGYKDNGEWSSPSNIPDYITEVSFYPEKPQTSKWNIEIHWDLLSRAGLLGRLPLEDWWRRRCRNIFQGNAVNVLDPGDALIYACAHQMLQHRGDLRLRWLLDIDRLIRGYGTYVISSSTWDRLIYELTDSEMLSVVQAGIRSSVQWYSTPLNGYLDKLLSKPLSREQKQIYFSFAIPNMTLFDTFRSDIKKVIGRSQKVQRAFRTFFPRPDYMVQRYQIPNRFFLPLYYLGRLIKGLFLVIRSQRL